MVDYVESTKYPFLDLKSFFIGVILNYLWFLIIPVIFVFGYMVEVIRETIKQSNLLPHWFTFHNWKRFFKHGISVFAILAIFLLPPIVISAASTTILGNPLEALAEGTTPKFNALGLSLSIISFIFLLISLFLLPISIILYAASENIHFAISPNEMLPRIKRALIPYLKAYVISLVLFFVSFALLTIPLIGYFIGFGFMFYSLLFSARIFAEIYRDYM
ncbi:MAG: DUF4013 domain-containing protein [Nanoarchaeota archaeon]|nr:DUF4013 domain-containing protein [Nanoarchaeota archaeon]